MLRTTINRIAAPVACFGIGTLFTLGCVIAADADDLAGPTIVPSSGQVTAPTWRSLTSQEIDVLTEGDDWDHPWESCEINAALRIWCGGDKTWHEYPAPEDGIVTDPGAHAAAADLDVCEGPDDEPTNLPCRVPTYPAGPAVDATGTVHDGCYIVLSNNRDSELVCADDTVWAS